MRILFLMIALGVRLSGRAELPQIAVEFETRVWTGKEKTAHTWSFERKGNQVSHRTGELTKRWTRVGEREIALEHVYSAEKLVIEFAQGDLKSIGATTNWNSLVHLIDTNLLSKLAAKRAGRVHDEEAVRYVGEVDNARWEILWIPSWELPAMIRREDKKGRMIIKIKKAAAPGVAASDPMFTRIDFADIGDMEGDERLRRVLQQNRQLHHGHKH